LACAEKIVLALMGFYVVWTISLYRIYKLVGEHEISVGVARYEKYADGFAGTAKHTLQKGLAAAGVGGAPPSLNLASLDYERPTGTLHDLLEDYQ